MRCTPQLGARRCTVWEKTSPGPAELRSTTWDGSAMLVVDTFCEGRGNVSVGFAFIGVFRVGARLREQTHGSAVGRLSPSE